jgi:hypothetical protein
MEDPMHGERDQAVSGLAATLRREADEQSNSWVHVLFVQLAQFVERLAEHVPEGESLADHLESFLVEEGADYDPRIRALVETLVPQLRAIDREHAADDEEV